MNIEKATVKDLLMLRKMAEVAKLQIARNVALELPDEETQLDLLAVQVKIEELEKILED